MGLVSGAMALGGGIAGLFGGGNSAQNVQLPQMFQFPNMGAAANNAFGGIGNLGQYNLYAPNIGTAQNITSGLVNNPYAGGYQTGANTAGSLGQLQALGQFGAGNALSGAAGNVLNTAFDPQNALYNRTLQQVQEQANAANAAAGVGTTPYGAGLTDQTLTNFNIDWQNAQLQRQLSGLSGAGSGFGQGAYLSGQAVPQYLQASAIPYGAFNTIAGGQLGALGGLGQFGQSASALPQQQIQDYLAYLGQGTGANSVANQQGQLALNQANQAFGQNQAFGNMIGQGLGAFGNAGYGIGGSGWGNLFGGGGGGWTGTMGGLGGGLGGFY